MSSIEICSQVLERKDSKLPLHLWDQSNLKEVFEKSSMEIFHINEVKLIDLQGYLNSSKETMKKKQIMVKIYSIFQDMSPIFRRLGIIELYQQLRLILSTFGRLAYSHEHKNSNFGQKIIYQQKEVILDSQQQKIVKVNTQHFAQQNNVKVNEKKNHNRLGGIHFFNESYIRNLDKHPDSGKKIINKKDGDECSKEEDLQRQQMSYYIERKKQLPILKIKDHSKKYQQIQQQFSAVEERIKQLIQSLQLQYQNQNLKSFQYLSKQQINHELVNFNMSMRSHLVILKEQYNSAAETLRQQNIQIKNKLQQQIIRKSSMVSVQVQTIQTIASIKKIKKLAEEYEQKIQKLENQINLRVKKQEDLRQHIQHITKSKDKQIASLYECIYSKNQLVQEFKRKCQTFEVKMNDNENCIMDAVRKFDEETKGLLASLLPNYNNTQQEAQANQSNLKQVLKFLNKRASRSSLRSISRHSRNSYFSQLEKMLDQNLPEEIQINYSSQSNLINLNEKMNSSTSLIKPNRFHEVKLRKSFKSRENGFQTNSIRKKQYDQKKQNENKIQSCNIRDQIKQVQENNVSQKSEKQNLKRNDEITIKKIIKNENIIGKESKQGKQGKSFNRKKSSNQFDFDWRFPNQIQKIKQNDAKDEINIKKLKSQQQKLDSNSKIKQIIMKNNVNLSQNRRQSISVDKVALKRQYQRYSVLNSQANIQNHKQFQTKQYILQKNKQKYQNKKQTQDIISQNYLQGFKKQGNNVNLNQYSRNNEKILKNSELSLKDSLNEINRNLTEIKNLIGIDLINFETFQMQFPQIMRIANNCNNSRTFCFQVSKIHKPKCKQLKCNHLQAYVQFYEKIKKFSLNRQAIKLPIQNFLSV